MSYLAKVLNKGRDTGSMEAVFQQSLEEINRDYPPGLIAYLKTNQGELWRRIVNLEGEIERAWLEGESQTLRKTSREYVQLFHYGQEKYLHQKSKLPEDSQSTFPFPSEHGENEGSTK